MKRRARSILRAHPARVLVGLLPCVVACMESRWEVCLEGALSCPRDAVCDVVHRRCAEPGETCIGADDETECDLGGNRGLCQAGRCLTTPSQQCGDGNLDPGEDCDGEDLNRFTCLTVPEHFYDEAGLRCGADCRFDTAECTGTCGDGVTNGPEVCDLTDPGTAVGPHCAESGLSAGHFECLGTCNGYSIDSCVRFGWTHTNPGFRPHGEQGITNLWGVEGQLVALAGTREIRWYDKNGWREWPGGYPSGEALPASELARAIWGAAMDDFWVAFPSGLAHWDGDRWSFEAYPNDIRALWGSAGDDIHGVGEEGRIHHYDGKTWSSIPSPVGAESLHDISGSGPTNVYAIGDRVLAHFDGTAWSASSLGRFSLTDVWTSAPDDVWVASGPRQPDWAPIEVLHFDGVEWSVAYAQVSTRTPYIAGRGRNDVWLVHGSYTRHFDGDGWASLWGGFSDTGLPIQSLWIDRVSTVIAGGGLNHSGRDDRVATWGAAGAIWELSPSGVRWQVAWGTGAGDLIAAGTDAEEQNIAYEFAGERQWTFQEPLIGMTGFDRDDVYAADRTGSVFHFDGSKWSRARARRGDVLGPLSIQAVGANELFLLESRIQDDIISRFDGTAWSATPVPNGCFPREMWVAAADDIWFVCGDRAQLPYLAHFDGVAMSDTPVDPDVRSIWGSGPDDVFALVTPRTVWHFDGTTWTATRVGLEGSFFSMIRGRAADDVFVLGTEGEIAHFDGRSWEPMAPLRLLGRAVLYDMVVASNAMFGVWYGDGFGGEIHGLFRTRLWNCRQCERDRDNRTDDDCDGQTDELDLGCERSGL